MLFAVHQHQSKGADKKCIIRRSLIAIAILAQFYFNILVWKFILFFFSYNSPIQIINTPAKIDRFNNILRTYKPFAIWLMISRLVVWIYLPAHANFTRIYLAIWSLWMVKAGCRTISMQRPLFGGQYCNYFSFVPVENNLIQTTIVCAANMMFVLMKLLNYILN